jgi:hypothetical protein
MQYQKTCHIMNYICMQVWQSPQILLLRSRCNRHSLGLGLQSLLGDQSCFGEGLQAGLGLQSCFGDGLQFWLDFHSCFGDGLHLSLFQLSFLPQSSKANPIRSDISYLAINSLFPMRSQTRKAGHVTSTCIWSSFIEHCMKKVASRR